MATKYAYGDWVKINSKSRWRAIIKYYTDSDYHTIYKIFYDIGIQLDGTNYEGSANRTFKVHGTEYSFTKEWSIPQDGTKYFVTDKNFSYDKSKSSVNRTVYFSVKIEGSFCPGTSSGSFEVTVPAKTHYSITYKANGGTGAPSTGTKWYGEDYTVSSVKPTRNGYKFTYWKISDTGDYVSPGGTLTRNKDYTLVAQWSYITKTATYKATYQSPPSGDITETKTQTIQEATYTAASSTVLTNLNFSKYVFNSWNTKSDGSGTRYSPGTTIKESGKAASDITLYAQLSPKTLTFNFVNDNTTIKSVQVTSTKATNNTVEGVFLFKPYKTFLGWFDISGNKVYDNNGKFVVGTYWNSSGYSVYANTNNAFITLIPKFQDQYVNLNFYGITSSTTSKGNNIFNLYSTVRVVKGEPFRIESYAPSSLQMFVQVKENGIDTGKYLRKPYWTKDRLADSIIYNNNTYDKNVIPLNYVIPPSSVYLSEVSEITLVKNTSLYAVYQDNLYTKVKLEQGSIKSHYVSDSDADFDSYLKYIKEGTVDAGLNLSVVGANNIICLFKFTSSNTSVTIDNNITVNPSWKDGTVVLNANNSKIITEIDGDIAYYYLIIKNDNNWLIPDAVKGNPQSLSFYLFDNIGKSVGTFSVNFIPPQIVYDVNKKGNAVSFFETAPDNNNEPIVNINGKLNVIDKATFNEDVTITPNTSDLSVAGDIYMRSNKVLTESIPHFVELNFSDGWMVRKWSNGTMEAIGTGINVEGSATAQSQGGVLYYSNFTYNLPSDIKFISVNSHTIASYSSASAVHTFGASSLASVSNGITTLTGKVWRDSSLSSTYTYSISFYIRGTWK